MADITKPHGNFVAGTVILSSEVNDQFNTLYQKLGGVPSASSITIVSTASDSVPLTLRQTASGTSQLWENASGSPILLVNSAGQMHSIMPTGQPPFIVDSQTMVANLNVEMLGGRTGAQFAQVDGGRMTLEGDVTEIVFRDTDGSDFGLRAGPILTSEALIFSDRSGEDPNGVALLAIFLDGTTAVKGNVSTEATAPVQSAHLTRKDYVDSGAASFSIVFHFPGAVSTDVALASYVVPPAAQIEITGMSLTYQSGTNSGTTEIAWTLNGAEQQSSVLTSQPTGQNVPRSGGFSPVSVSPGDVVTVSVLSVGAHADVSLQLDGVQTIRFG